MARTWPAMAPLWPANAPPTPPIVERVPVHSLRIPGVPVIVMTDDRIVSDATAHIARRIVGTSWTLSWLGGVVDEQCALEGMLLADEAANPRLNSESPAWPWVETWAHQLGLSGVAAVAAVRDVPTQSVQATSVGDRRRRRVTLPLRRLRFQGSTK